MGPASLGAQTTSEFDLAGFRAQAVIAEEVVERATASSTFLESLRADLSVWRDQSLAEQERVKSKVDDVQTRLDALGPKPEGEDTEAAEVAARRIELQADLAKASGPLLTAEEAYARADGLITSIDRLLRERQTTALIEVGPSPLNPARWPVVWVETETYLSGMWGDISSAWTNPYRTRIRWQNAPVIVLSLLLAYALVFPVRRWLSNGWNSSATSNQGRYSGVRTMIWSLLSLAVPILGIGVLTRAIDLMDLVSFRGTGLLTALPIGFAFVFGAIWLSTGLRPLIKSLFGQLETNEKLLGRGHKTVLILGWVLMLKTLLDSVSETQSWVPATYSFYHFPMVALAAIGLWRVSKLMRQINKAEAAKETSNRITLRLSRYCALATFAIAVIGPIACGVGYTQLGSTLVFSTVLTLALIATLWVLFDLMARLGEIFWPKQTQGTSEGPQSGALFKVIVGFVLMCAALPVLALIWGARVSDLGEVWVSLREGVALGDTRISLTDFLTFIVVFAIGYTLTRIVKSALKNVVLPNTSMEQGAQSALVTGAGYIGVVIAALVAITSTGLDLSNLTIVAGALSVGVGFGLQAIVSNFVSGIILLIERPVSEGDWIEVGGHSGYVRDISVRSTTIETFDRATVIVPNADLISNSVTNWTHGVPTGRVRVPVGVSYDSNPEHIKQVLFDIAQAHPMVLRNPSPSIVFMGFGPDSMDFEIRVIIRDVNWMLSVHSDMNYEIVRRFREEGIEIPFAQREVTIKNAGDFVGKKP